MKYFAEFRTTSELENSNQSQVYIWSLISYDKKQTYNGSTIDEFMKLIGELEDQEIIYFHKLNYDGAFILDWLYSNGYSQGTKASGKKISYLKTENNNYMNIKMMIGKQLIHFDNTRLLIPMSINDIRTSLKIKGDNFDWDGKRLPKNDATIKSTNDDVELIIDCFNEFEKQYPNHKSTLAMTTYNDFKQFYGETKFYQDFGGAIYDKKEHKMKRENLIKQDVLDAFQKNMFGGFCGVNPKYENQLIEEYGTRYDVNGLYSHIMKNNKMPYGKLLKVKPKGSSIRVLHIHIIKATKTDLDMPSHLHNVSGKTGKFNFSYLDGVENEFYIYTEREFNELKKTYKIEYEIVETWWVKSKYVFAPWLQKKLLKKYNAKNPLERLIAKLILNALFGKFIERWLRVNKITKLDMEHKLFGKRYGKYGEYVEYSNINKSVNRPYSIMGLVILSFARCVTLKAIRANKENVVYWDTDSVKVIGEVKGIQIHPKKVGYWKCEGNFVKIKVLKPKTLMMEDKDGKIERVIGGLVKSKHKDISWDQFNVGNKFIGYQWLRKQVKGGCIRVKSDFTL